MSPPPSDPSGADRSSPDLRISGAERTPRALEARRGYSPAPMNPRLARLQPYPFERLRTLLEGVSPPEVPPIRLSIGEPQHPTPEVVRRALTSHLDGLAQ